MWSLSQHAETAGEEVFIFNSHCFSAGFLPSIEPAKEIWSTLHGIPRDTASTLYSQRMSIWLHWSLSSTCLSADDLTLNRDFWLHKLCERRNGYHRMHSMKRWECKKIILIQSKQYFAAQKGYKRGNEIQDVGLINSMYCLYITEEEPFA